MMRSAWLDPVREPTRRLSPQVLAPLAVLLVAFLALNVAIAVLIVSGRLDGHWYDFRDLGNAVQALREWLDDRTADQPGWLSDLLGDHWLSYIVTALIGAIGILSFVGVVLLVLIWVERRLIGRIQVRRGPNRVGPFGLLQPFADAIKLIQKETLIPRGADRFMFYLPPVLVFIPGLLVWAPVPWAPHMSYLDINVGVLYLIAISSLSTLAIFMAGWSSNNHYALLGAMRTVAMMISYEIPLSIALLSVVLFTGSMQLSEIVQWQADHNMWLGVLMPLALFTFFFSSTAELNRTPNDIAEAESEIVAGFHTEYSGMKFGLFYAVELGNAVAVAAFVGTFFLGGWSLFGLEEWVPPYLVFALKIAAGYFVLVWLRGTLPRFRLDQLMMFAWKYLIPISLLQVILVAFERSIFEHWDVPGVIPLALFTIVNAVFAVRIVRFWARFLGYRPERETLLAPTLTRSVGGLQAAQRMRTVR
ncbi:MAG: NADH-quinone oxidoreductase subunit NuoH [Dehalococcoidia bacterium]|nr:NADH-quinone oxidoreductase subunit NuoH [Dehalococcoidia bacterium]